MRTELGAADGFTLLEMIVVLVVAGLLTGLVLERGPLRSRHADLMAARNTVLVALRTARQDALGSGHRVEARFDPQRHGLVVAGGANRPRFVPLPPDVAVKAPPAAERESSLLAPMFFSPDGMGYGTAWQIDVSGHALTISISPLTGRILSDAP